MDVNPRSNINKSCIVTSAGATASLTSRTLNIKQVNSPTDRFNAVMQSGMLPLPAPGGGRTPALGPAGVGLSNNPGRGQPPLAHRNYVAVKSYPHRIEPRGHRDDEKRGWDKENGNHGTNDKMAEAASGSHYIFLSPYKNLSSLNNALPPMGEKLVTIAGSGTGNHVSSALDGSKVTTKFDISKFDIFRRPLASGRKPNCRETISIMTGNNSNNDTINPSSEQEHPSSSSPPTKSDGFDTPADGIGTAGNDDGKHKRESSASTTATSLSEHSEPLTGDDVPRRGGSAIGLSAMHRPPMAMIHEMNEHFGQPPEIIEHYGSSVFGSSPPVGRSHAHSLRFDAGLYADASFNGNHNSSMTNVNVNNIQTHAHLHTQQRGLQLDTPVQDMIHEPLARLALAPPRFFRPMHAIDPTFATARIPSSQAPSAGGIVQKHCFSENYRGERSARNCSASIPDTDNCSLWLTNLPTTITHHDLLSGIHNVGRVYATVINPPDSGHATSAAKLVFFTREAAQALYLQSQVHGLFVGPMRARVGWNRIKTSAQEPGKRSRVLIISGHSSFVNEHSLTC